MKLVRITLLIAAALKLTGCYDTSEAYPIDEAKAAFEQVPLLSQDEYEAARQAAADRDANGPQEAAPLSNNQAKGPDARLTLSDSCDQIPDYEAGSVRLVAAFQEASPANDLIRQTRLHQDRIAACFVEAGVNTSFRTRTNQDDLAAPSEIQLYFGQ